MSTPSRGRISSSVCSAVAAVHGESARRRGRPWRTPRACFSGIVLSGVGRGEGLDVQGYSGAFGSLVPVLAHSSRCGMRARGGELLQRFGCEQVAIGLVGAHRDRDAQFVLAVDRTPVLGPTPVSQRLTNSDATDSTTGGDLPSLSRRSMALHVGLGRGQVLLAREQQRHVDGDPVEDRFLDRRGVPSGVPGILMNRFPAGAACACRLERGLDRARACR